MNLVRECDMVVPVRHDCPGDASGTDILYSSAPYRFISVLDSPYDAHEIVIRIEDRFCDCVFRSFRNIGDIQRLTLPDLNGVVNMAVAVVKHLVTVKVKPIPILAFFLIEDYSDSCRAFTILIESISFCLRNDRFTGLRQQAQPIPAQRCCFVIVIFPIFYSMIKEAVDAVPGNIVVVLRERCGIQHSILQHNIIAELCGIVRQLRLSILIYDNLFHIDIATQRVFNHQGTDGIHRCGNHLIDWIRIGQAEGFFVHLVFEDDIHHLAVHQHRMENR